jgi:4-amino-4-deoxy-L-arabinose transferase-like glycosyltransferase
MGCGVLTKGPVAIAVPLLTMAVYFASMKNLRGLRHLRLGPGLLIVCLVVGIWLVPACLTGGEGYWKEIIFRQIFGRAVDSFSHKKPVYFYLIDFPGTFLPWSFFIPSVLVWLWRSRRARSELRLSLSWFAATFVLFSLISGKRSVYLLPLYPAAAQVIAVFWSWVLQPCASEKTFSSPGLLRIPSLLLSIGLCGIGAASTFSIITGSELPGILAYLMPARSVAICLGITGGAVGIALFTRRQLTAMFWHISAVTTGAFIMTVFFLLPALYAADDAFCRSVQQAVGVHEPLVATFEPSYFNYFLRRETIPVVKDIAALERLVASDNKIFILTEKNKYERAPAHLRDRVTIIADGPVGRQEICLIVNRAAGADADPLR